MPGRMPEASPRFKARMAGAFYLVNILAGALALFVRGNMQLAVLFIATACYLAVTLLFYGLFKPVSRRLSLLAVFFSLVGCFLGILGPLHVVRFRINNLVFFGGYCVLIGYLIFRSVFLPRILGGLMVFGGLGWLTFLSSSLATYLSPYNMAPGILGELSLTLWLLIVGVNERRWKEQTGVSPVPR